MSSTDEARAEEEDLRPLEDADLLEEMVRALVDRPEAVRVQEKVEGDRFELLIHVHREDRRHVIGRQGQMVMQLRRFFGVIAARKKRRILIEVVETEEERMALRGPRPMPV